MKKPFFFLLAVTALALVGTNKAESTPAHNEIDLSVSFFYSSLSPYGEWIEVDAGFYAWRPLRVHRAWRPYLYGRWVWTDYGWYWVSYEPFGWAVFHYGRWYYDDYYGWIWIPDRVWGPAWVEWRFSDDYIGWAPLPPYATFSFSVGIRFTTRWVAPAPYWTFVRYRHFTVSNVERYATPPEYTRRLIGVTRTVSRYEVDRDRIINRGVDRTIIERNGNTRIERYDIAITRDRAERIVRADGRNRVEVYRPDTDPTVERDAGSIRIEARRPERRISLDVNRIERSGIERPADTRNRERGAERWREDQPELRAPEREIGRENRDIDRQQESNRERENSRKREVERPSTERPSMKEYLDQRKQEFARPEGRSREQWFAPFYERREMMRERPTGRERVSPPSIQREPVRPAPEMRRGGESQPQGGSRGEGRKRNRD
jgi:hypothetical protein